MFIAAAVFLRMTEGVGSSLAFTGMYTLLPELFPSRVGLVMVRQSLLLMLLLLNLLQANLVPISARLQRL